MQLDHKKLKGDIQDFKKKMEERGIVQIPHFAPLCRFTFLKQLGYDTAAMQESCPNAEEAFSHKYTRKQIMICPIILIRPVKHRFCFKCSFYFPESTSMRQSCLYSEIIRSAGIESFLTLVIIPKNSSLLLFFQWFSS